MDQALTQSDDREKGDVPLLGFRGSGPAIIAASFLLGFDAGP